MKTLKKILFIIVITLVWVQISYAQKLNDAPNFNKYSLENKGVMARENKEKMVVFIGNSITEGWVREHPMFFTSNQYVGRGISGQTSPQLLLRFRKDVIDLKPVAVVINIGTNDIAENSGTYNFDFTVDNIKSMAEIAEANGIRVILSSVLPVGEYPWRKEIQNVPQQIDNLNKAIKEFACSKGYAYIDYNTVMRDDNGAMRVGLSRDGVHPVSAGYDIMESLAKTVIDEVLTD